MCSNHISIYNICFHILAAEFLRFIYLWRILFHNLSFKVVRAGLNVDVAPDLIANQLNVRNGALVLRVNPQDSLVIL